MAFGLFKKKNFADALFINANLVTDDEELSGCTWIAVKDGLIHAIGEEDTYASLQGKNTAVYDLKGKFLSPGLIDAFADPASELMSDIYIKADPGWTEDELIAAAGEYARSKKDAGFCLITEAPLSLFSNKEESGTSREKAGADESTEDDGSKGFTEKLDESTADLPTVIMFEDGMSLRLNHAAADMVVERADELGVTTIDPSLALDTVIAIDYSSKAEELMKKSFASAEKGYSCLFGVSSTGYFGKLYKDLLTDSFSAGMIKQRFFASRPLKRMINPHSVVHQLNKDRTSCIELDGKINYVTLSVIFSSDEGSFSYMTEKYLKELLEEVCDQGYSVRVTALDKNAALTALSVMGELSSQYKKQSFLLLSDYLPTDDEKSEIFTGNVIGYPLTGCESFALTGQDDWILKTAVAAQNCGIYDKLGTLEEGKLADFAIFDEDPRKTPSMADLKAYMTVISGEPVYTRGQDDVNDWIAVIREHMESVVSDFIPEELEKESEEQ